MSRLACLGLPLQLLLLLLLLPAASVQGQSDATTVVPTNLYKPLYHAPVVVQFASNKITYSFIQQVASSYVLVRPQVTINITRNTDTLVRNLMQYNSVDVGTYGSSLSTSLQAIQPDTVAYPNLAIGVVPVYNLPNQPINFRLIMSSLTLSMVYTGNITMWNDARITAENPGATMPNATITVVLRTQSVADTKILSYAMAAIDPYWAATVGMSGTVKWPTSRYASYVVGDPGTSDSYTAPIARVLSTNYSIAYSTYNAAADVQASIALMINKANATVDCTSTSLTVAATEKGVGSNLNAWADCSNANSAAAWPICGYNYVFYNSRQIATTCETKTEAIRFLSYIITSQAAASLATNIALLTPAIQSTMPVPPLLCGSTPIDYSTINQGILSGNAILQYFLSPTLKFYTNLDSTRSYVYQKADRFAALQQLLNGEVDITVLSPDISRDVSPVQWYDTIESGSVSVLPSFLIATAPTFNLPAAIISMSSKTFNYSDPYNGGTGLMMNINVLPQIMMGRITQWNDPAILSINPALAERFAYAAANNITVNTQITLIVCCSGDQADQSTGSHFFYTLYKAMLRAGTITGNPAAYDVSWFNVIPFTWNATVLSILTQRGAQYTMATQQSQLDILVQNTPGAVSYHMSLAPTFQTQLEFGWLALTSDNSTQPIVSYPVSDYMSLYLNLTSAPSDVNDYGLQHASPALPPARWPFTMLQSFVVLSRYYNGVQDITNVNKTLNMLNWMMYSDSLAAAVNSAGLMRVSNNVRMYQQTKRQLDYITCDGTNCLITLPYIWSLTGSIAGFGYASAIIGLVLCIGTFATLIYFQHRTVYRSASIAFLALINFGLCLLFLSAIPIVQSPPSLASCGSFAWLVDFGWCLTFTPLFLKMYRIYKIFNRKQLKVVKLSNLKLLSYLAVVVLAELVLISVWQGVAPLAPITTHIWQGVLDNQYNQCNVQTAGQPYLVILGVIKACFLLFGTVMSFSTRKVSSTFNESSSVGWSIYNAIFACIIIISIVAFVGAVGDTLVLMELFLVLWVAYSTWAFVFGTKLFTIAQGEKAEAYSHLESQRTHTGGFSFVSVDALTQQTMPAYVAALEQHMASVKRRQAIMEGRSGSASTTKNPYSNSAEAATDDNYVTKQASGAASDNQTYNRNRKSSTSNHARSPSATLPRQLPEPAAAAGRRQSSAGMLAAKASAKGAEPSTPKRSNVALLPNKYASNQASVPLHDRYAGPHNLFLSPLIRKQSLTARSEDVVADEAEPAHAPANSCLSLPNQTLTSTPSVTVSPADSSEPSKLTAPPEISTAG